MHQCTQTDTTAKALATSQLALAVILKQLSFEKIFRTLMYPMQKAALKGLGKHTLFLNSPIQFHHDMASILEMLLQKIYGRNQLKELSSGALHAKTTI